MNVNTEILTILQDAKLQIQANLASYRINASGRTSNSLKVIDNINGVRLISESGDNAPIPTLEIGNIGGEYNYLYPRIQQWIKDKKIDVSNPDNFANYVTWKIIKTGTDRYNNNFRHVYTPVIEDVKTKVRQILKNALILTIKDNK